MKTEGLRHLLSVDDVSWEEIEDILGTAASFEQIGERAVKKVPTLRGMTVVNLFYENSTRTRVSFELAAKRLSADVITVSATTSSVQKGESLRDTARTLRAMGADAIILRHPCAGTPAQLARWVDASVINAGDGAHEHPTQALLDVYTARQRFGSLDDKRVLFIGDISHSRVARSGTLAFQRMGANVTVVAPPTMVPPEIDVLGCSVSYDLDAVLEGADIVYLLRLQRERHTEPLLPSEREYVAGYGLTRERLARLGPDTVVMHPGPMNRGLEIDWDAAESAASLIESQVTAGIAVRMALLYTLLGSREAAA